MTSNEVVQSRFGVKALADRRTRVVVGGCALGALLFLGWLTVGTNMPLDRRMPGGDHAPAGEGAGTGNAVLAGKLIKGEGTAAELPGAWPGFRGSSRTGAASVRPGEPLPNQVLSPEATMALAR